MKNFVNFVCFGLLVVTVSGQINIHEKLYKLKQPKILNKVENKAGITGRAFELVFDQQLDHFNIQDTRTFEQRFWLIEDDIDERIGGPIFIHIASDWFDFNEDYLRYLHVPSFALANGGLVLGIEPRFFGKSRPTELLDDLSFENLRYLTIDQTLADFANIIDYIRESEENPKVILYGWDLGGAYAVWLRKKYPHLVDGVIAYSPTLDAIVEHSQYLQDSLNTVASISPQCHTIIDYAFDEMAVFIYQQDGEIIQQLFNLAQPLDVFDILEVGTFYSAITQLMSSYIFQGNEYQISLTCNKLINFYSETQDDLAALSLLFQSVFGNELLHISYAESVAVYTDPSWEGYAASGPRQVYYRQCTEASHFRTSGELGNPNLFPRELFIQNCNDVLSPIITNATLEDGNRRTNVANGGQVPTVDNVYITYGGIDPDRLLGPSQDINANAPVDIVPGESKHFNLLPPSIYDSAAVLVVKQRAEDLITQWINN